MDTESAIKLEALLGDYKPDILYGVEGTSAIAASDGADMVVSAIVGAAGLVPTVSAIKAGKHIALANKETLVVAGQLVSDLVKKHKVRLLPVDSEHSAIFQSLEGHRKEDVERIILTASGGPFRNTPEEELKNVSLEQALKHPQWSMGAKITIDSATMMNKGLEVIEAFWLFGLPLEKIKVLIHPQSVVHSMVRYRDGSVLAQMGQPDMRTPIAYGLAWPERIEAGVAPLNLAQLASLNFSEPELARFPCLSLAFAAAKAGGTAPAVLNAANEVVVAAFLDSGLPYLQIASLVERVLNTIPVSSADSLETILSVDTQARKVAQDFIAALYK